MTRTSPLRGIRIPELNNIKVCIDLDFYFELRFDRDTYDCVREQLWAQYWRLE